MLLRFSAANHLSLKTPQELNLTPTLSRKGEWGVIHDERSGLNASRVVGIFGPNASGKSNVLAALSFMGHAVRDSHSRWAPEGGTPTRPFALDPAAADLPSEFQADIVLNGVLYSYGFALTSKTVLEEWLYAYPSRRPQKWFSREQLASGEDSFVFGRSLGGENKVIERLTRRNSLFLSAAAANNHEQLTPIYSWFAGKIRHISLQELRFRISSEIANLPTNEPALHCILSLLKSADLGIVDLNLHDEEPTPDLAKLFESIGQVLEVPQSLKPVTSIPILELLHRSEHRPEGVPIPLDLESAGTVVWLGLCKYLLEAFQDGALLAVDELGGSLHPMLVRQAIDMVQNPRSNPHDAQLLFNTHDTNLLGNMFDRQILMRDQIWLTEKDNTGATTLRPMTDFKPRKDENLQRGYMQGRYGAIPITDTLQLPLFDRIDHSDAEHE